jgi:DNA-binding NarL/FixJ family response regulator
MLPFGALDTPLTARRSRDVGCARHPEPKEVPHAFSGPMARMDEPVQPIHQQQHDVRVLVAHHSLLLAESLGRLLEDLGLAVVGSACDPQALLSRLADGSADALVLDVGFDPISGPLGTLDRIRSVAPGLHVVVIADALDAALSVAARDGDLDGVVLASAAGAELVAALTQVVAGHAVFPAGWLRQLKQSAEASPLGQLSPRQREVLELLSLGMDNDQIAARLYISRNTVKFHVRTIYGRLGVHNRVEAARVLAGASVVSAA